MISGTLYVSRDFVKNRPHIHYLMCEMGHNSRGIVATYNSKKKTITLKEPAFELVNSYVANEFIRLAMENEEKALAKEGADNG